MTFLVRQMTLEKKFPPVNAKNMGYSNSVMSPPPISAVLVECMLGIDVIIVSVNGDNTIRNND